MPVTRLATLDDAPALAALQVAGREALGPWAPRRDDDWFTADRGGRCW
jgi:[ribosomal protein S5]-alanine N-acetyltransferase